MIKFSTLHFLSSSVAQATFSQHIVSFEKKRLRIKNTGHGMPSPQDCMQSRNRQKSCQGNFNLPERFQSMSVLLGAGFLK